MCQPSRQLRFQEGAGQEGQRRRQTRWSDAETARLSRRVLCRHRAGADPDNPKPFQSPEPAPFYPKEMHTLATEHMVIRMDDNFPGWTMPGVRHRLFAALMFLVFGLQSGTSSALAADSVSREATTCVLAQLDHIEGQVSSGSWQEGSPPTIEAIRNLRSHLDRMAPGERVATCYALARLGGGLDRHMPAYAQQVQLHLPPVLEPQRKWISSLTRKALDHVQTGFKALAPLQVHLYMGQSLEEVQRLAAASGFTPNDLEWPGHQWHQGCRPRNFLVGLANSKRVLICVTDIEDFTSDAADEFKSALMSLIAHEYFHSFQLQVSAALGGRRYDADATFGKPGPAWMLEGVAHYVGYRTAETPLQIRSRLERTVADYGYSQADRCRILKRQQRSFETVSGPRAVALLAVMDLEELAGSDSFARFYNDIGFTLDWRDSFERVYGGAPEELLGCEVN